MLASGRDRKSGEKLGENASGISPLKHAARGGVVYEESLESRRSCKLPSRKKRQRKWSKTFSYGKRQENRTSKKVKNTRD